MYASWDYYQNEYGGTAITEESTFNRISKQVIRIMDRVTIHKLEFAFPTNTKDAESVYECACQLTDFIYIVDNVKSSQMQTADYTVNTNGIVTGKVAKTISSGSESVSFGTDKNIYVDAHNDPNAFNKEVMNICRTWLSGVSDKNGVGLLFAGMYPKRFL